MNLPSTIALVEAFVLPYREDNDHGSTRFACLTRIEDDDGVVGWGEAATIMEGAARATAALIIEYADRIGGLPADPVAITPILRDVGWWFGGAGIDSFAVSAIDMALWDLHSRRSALPVLEALGGTHRKLPLLISSHASNPDLISMSDEIAGWVERSGAVGAKVAMGKRGPANLGVEPKRDIDFVKELRRALGSRRIMIDIAPTLGWGYDEAVARINDFEEWGVDWIEEPLGARNRDGYARLKQIAGTVRIAFGEREWTPSGVDEILADGAVDVVGMDPGRILGITGYLQAAESCRLASRQANAHAFAGPLIYSAALAASMVSPACTEFEIAPARNELYDILGAPDVEAGSLFRDQGLGFDVDEGSVRRQSG